MARRRRQQKCCCTTVPPSDPPCGECSTATYECETTPRYYENWGNFMTNELGGEEKFNMMPCAIGPQQFNYQKRVIDTFSRFTGDEPLSGFFAVCLGNMPSISGVVPWTGSPPWSNAGVIGYGSEYDAIAGSLIELTDFHPFPDGYVPRSVLAGEELAFNGSLDYWYVPSAVESECCAYNDCSVYGGWPGPTGEYDGSVGPPYYTDMSCYEDICACNNIDFIDCAGGFYQPNASRWKQWTYAFSTQCTGGGIRAYINGCKPRVEAIAHFNDVLPWGTRTNRILRFGATGYFDPNAMCDGDPQDQYYIPLSEASFHGDINPYANAPLRVNGPGNCNCLPDIWENGGTYDVDCRCEKNWGFKSPNGSGSDCPTPIVAQCYNEAGEDAIGIYSCNSCGVRTGGGHFWARMGI